MAALRRVLLTLVLAAVCRAQNNAPPEFDVTSYSFDVLEGLQPGENTTIGTITAFDLEGDPIEFYIEANSINSVLFAVSNSGSDTATLYPRVFLDREQHASDNAPLRVVVRVRDGEDHGEDVLDAAVPVFVSLLDVNDNSPVITNLPVEVSLREDVVPGNPQSRVEVFDVASTDADVGFNARPDYAIVTVDNNDCSLEPCTGSCCLFDIVVNNGIIQLAVGESLNFDIPGGEVHRLLVSATDNGVPRLSDEAILTVNVEDVNDLDPVFLRLSYAAEVHENVTMGTSIVQVRAVDQDMGINDTILYSIVGGNVVNGTQYFDIDRSTGVIFVSVAALDRETVGTYSLSVQAEERNDSARTASVDVSIKVLDINDHPPQFLLLQYSVQVPESAELGRVVVTATAFDPDEGSHAEFEFSLVNLQNGSLPFSVASADNDTDTAEVRIAELLDFEEQNGLFDTYTFQIVATEEFENTTRSGFTVVTVEVTNVNDLNPAFAQQGDYQFNISEIASVGSFVGAVLATDDDRGTFGDVSYFIIGDDSLATFNISMTTGIITTAAELDFETTTSYDITVIAEDMAGDPALINSATTVVVVSVENVNDNPPVFTDDNGTPIASISLPIAENSPPDQEVLALRVTDEDDDLTPHSFEIISGNMLGHFVLSGAALNTTISLDYDFLSVALRSYTLQIRVNDSANIDILRVDITLVDLNDNSPIFANDSYLFTVYENEPMGALVDTVDAVDIDSEAFGEVRYSIVTQQPIPPYFTINDTTGEILTNIVFDRERETTFTLVVMAADGGSPSGTNTTNVRINILDRNDNTPQFNRTSYQFSTNENTESVSFPVTATDRDSGDNGRISFSIRSGNTDNTFIINEQTGVITRNASVVLDFESVAEFQLEVVAADNGDVSRESTVQVLIDILDLNDITPQFSAASYNVSFSEDVPAGTIVARLAAADGDSGDNGRLVFSITAITSTVAGPDGSFSLDADDGFLRTTGSFDRELFDGAYSIDVLVADSGSPSRNSASQVLVYINDANDMTPVFQNEPYTASIEESLAMPQLLTTLEAVDGDLSGSPNAAVTFSITDVFPDPQLGATLFEVDNSTGEVFAVAPLDFESVSMYRITVEASDQGDTQRSSNSFVVVTVLDINDQVPQFSQVIYTINAAENTPLNTRFSAIVATDRDQGSNAAITFTANITTPFRVDPGSGQVILTASLDFESEVFYSFEVVATDGGSPQFENQTLVEVNVLDANDHSPQFSQVVYLATVAEGNYTGAPEPLVVVSASDRDSGVFGEVRYQVFPEDGIFFVEPVTGLVVAEGELDRETQDSYLITIVARDGGSPANTATAQVVIAIQDENDNTPELDSLQYAATVREDTPVGTIVAMVSASDEDVGFNSDVMFSIDDTVTFSIDPYSGVVTTNRLFDFESVRSYQTFIRATDNGTVPLEDSAPLTLNISDANDNQPQLVLPFPPQVFLNETAPLNTLVLNVVAMDTDSGSNGELVYQLANEEGRFSVDANGVITLTATLDFETTVQYNITVTVSDRGQPQQSLTDFLIVAVTDVNDNPPVFERDEFSFVVPEDFSFGSVGFVGVTDLDAGLFGDLDIEIVGPDASHFTTFPALGGVDIFNTVDDFDFESQSLFTIRVNATNVAFPFHSASADVTVILSDINDNAPSFSLSSYTLAVPESAPLGTPVGTVVATDSDGGINGTVVYSFGSLTSTFELNATSGVITLTAVLDFETVSSYSLQVEASDLSTQPQTSIVPVIVNVMNNNEQGPQFDSDTYTFSVLENLAANSFVGSVSATEADAGGVVEYSIVTGPTNRFQIDMATGLITTVIPLDREEQDRYILTVSARDMGDVVLETFTQVDVTVEDVNDNAPDFALAAYTFDVQENLQASVGVVTASDRDAGSNAELSYTLSAGTPFDVESSTGVISVAVLGGLDRETISSYSFQLTATDQGSARLAGVVPITVRVTDTNDNIPVFGLPQYSASVAENSGAGVSVVTVQATDNDGDSVSYQIISGDDPAPNSKFLINPSSGLIETTLVALDYEQLEAINYMYVLTVGATDARSSATQSVVQVVVSVVDVNDNVPVCPSSGSLQFSIQEAQTLEVRAGTVSASDEDSGANAVVSYSIVSGDASLFRIEQTSGILFGQRDLDFESTSVHTLGIQALDNAPDPSNRLSATCTVTVTLIDVNDNPPVFSRAIYDATVVENATIGSVITTEIVATDVDTGANALITYSLQSSTRVFAIDANTGAVTLTASLDADVIDRYDVDVEASDGERIGRATLVVRVLDVDDTRPVFDRSFYVQTISENAPPDSSIITLEASDRDSSLLFYDIVQGNEDGSFKISPNTGLIETASTLDREEVAVFSLVVMAMDTTGNNGSTTLQVTVLDINDEAPQFLQPSYTARVTENSPTGTQVLPELNGTTIRIEAVDADQPNTQNSRVLYRLEGEDADQFNINFDTGIISVALGASLDREVRDMLSVTVVASDSVPAPDTQTNSVLLTVLVLDENDLPPVFSQRFGYSVPVSEALAVGSLVTGEIRATDLDTGSGGVVRYSLSNASPLQAITSFFIDALTGDLTLVGSLDRETDPTIVLTVTASDQGVPARSSVVSVQISISDANDNAPEFARDTFTTTVSELQGVAEPAYTIVAQDPDTGLNAVVSYSLLPSVEPFTINPNTGVISTTASLDHESQASHTITVEACDSGSPQLCATATVVFIVLDFNDERPQFDLQVYQVDVAMGTPAGTPLVQPVATDRDSGSNSVLSYSLRDHAPSRFTIDTTSGLISLASAADDITDYLFTVLAEDGGATPLSGTAMVVVRVLNDTERDFMFAEPYFTFAIDEGSNTFVGALTSVPLETLPPSIPGLTVQFAPDYPLNPFTLLTNFVSLKSAPELAVLGLGQFSGLDREVRDLYTVIVRAELGGQFSYTSVTVRVLDQNDNIPVFVADLYPFSVRENETAPLDVGAVLAEDRDAGVNAEISYQISSVQPPSLDFTVDSVTGLISTAAELDRESTAQYRLFIEASDGVGTDSTQVLVEVLDTNDCTPTFDQPEYNAPILENLPPGARVTTVTATDCDAGINAVLRYSIVGGDSSLFQLDAMSGAVTTLATLDFEVEDSYYLQVEVTDLGSPQPLSSRVDVNIPVLDFNDCPPEFVNPPSSVSVLENATINSLLVAYEVSDCDSGLNGPNGTRFTIIAGNVDGLFEITAESGSLLTLSSLDREQQDSYLLSIQARDSAGLNSLSSVTQLTVVVQDVNDNAPVFTSPQVTRIVDEGEELSTELVTVQASDVDAGLNGMILYSLEDDFGVFRMDDGTGALSLINSLDHELTDSYDLVVIARDRGAEPRSSNATISIIVRDENDNAPVITNIISGVTSVEVLESALSVTIFTVEAVDQDSGSNGEITFSLTDATRFSISSSGGAISVSGSLDYETQNEYTLVVTATDQGAQQLSGVETLTVRVLDENDNDPEFQTANYMGMQTERSPPGTSIVTVTATDADQTGSTNAEVFYSLMEDIRGDFNFFSVDPDTGVVSNTVSLDRETQDLFMLTVVANNSLSVTARTATATVQVMVLDVNDETPEFLEPVYNGTLSELASIGAVVTVVSGRDEDEAGTSNSELIYLLPQSSNNPFHLEPNTGVLTLQSILNFEERAFYNLSVTVEDKGTTSRTGTATILVSVEDENDLPPLFEEDIYRLSVSEGVSVFPHNITLLRFTDADSAPVNQTSIFSIESVEGSNNEALSDNPFRVTTDNNGIGRVTLTRALDFESRDFYVISLSVLNTAPGAGALCDPAPSCVLRDSATLRLTVENENDNSPIFDTPLYTGQVSSSAPPGTAVLTVRALDADSGDGFGAVDYRLDNTADGRFRIDESTGTIFTRGDFADLEGFTYNLLVSAFDNNGVAPSNSNSTVVSLVVLNDFQRVRILFLLPYEAILRKQATIVELLRGVSGYDIVVEDYADFSNDQETNFIFHAIDTRTNRIVDFDEFFAGSAEDILFQELRECNISVITPFADIEGYTYPGAVDTQTIVILVLCLLLILGAIMLLGMSLRQRYLALHDTRHKLLADVFYHSPTSGSVVENLHHENYNLEFEMTEHRQGDRQNPVYLKPYAGWSGVDTESGLDSGGEVSSLQRDNVLYESQELRMELFADESEGEGGEVEADDDALLAAALHDGEEGEEDDENAVTAI